MLHPAVPLVAGAHDLGDGGLALDAVAVLPQDRLVAVGGEDDVDLVALLQSPTLQRPEQGRPDRGPPRAEV